MLQLLATVLALLLGWRIWRFTIRPRLHPQEPKEFPYWIPFIGHAKGFFDDFNGAIEQGRKYFERTQGSREPFIMTVAGQTIYVATSAEDIGHVWKNSKTMSRDPLAMEMYTTMGISEKSREALFKPHLGAKYNTGTKPLTPTQMALEYHVQQQSGARLTNFLETKIIPNLFNHLEHIKSITPVAVDSSATSKIVSLHDLCVDLFVTHQTKAFWGPQIIERSPDFIKSFISWEYTSWKFMFKIPAMFAKDMEADKEGIVSAFSKYYSLPRDQRPDAIPFATALEDMLREIGLNEDEMARFTLLHYWAIIGNVYKLAFWLIAHLVQDPRLVEQIREEIMPAIHENSIDETYLSDQCPRLDSLVSETLRLTIVSALARVVIQPCQLNGKTLHPGHKIMLPTREIHHDTQVWGSEPAQLHPDRFLENPKLSKNASFRPWGGGHTLCPGRVLARRSINAFVAILLKKYDIEKASDEFPRADGARPTPGAVSVELGDDVRLRLTKRS